MTQSMLLGPRCNHDLGVLLRLPIVNPEIFDEAGSVDQQCSLQDWAGAVEEMVDTMTDHEFYCSNYAAREQPHVEGLLQSLVDGVRHLDREIAEQYEAGKSMEQLERAKRLLNRLISSTNRRMHKGYPEMLSYLLQKPSYYCSHSFVTLLFHQALRLHLGHVADFIQGKALFVAPVSSSRTNFKSVNFRNSMEDYIFRPLELEKFPWYFFVAACGGRTVGDSSSLPWHESESQKHPCYQFGKPVPSKSLGCSLQENGEVLRDYPFFVSLRTHEAWQVPMLMGKFPKLPTEQSSVAEKGEYALAMMLLFRSWRGTQCADFLRRLLGDYVRGLPADHVWKLVYANYMRWRQRHIVDVAAP